MFSETRLKKFDLELKTEPKDYNSDHNSLDDRDDPCPAYSDDDAEGEYKECKIYKKYIHTYKQTHHAVVSK